MIFYVGFLRVFVRNSARCEFRANRQAQIDDFADMVNGQCAGVVR